MERGHPINLRHRVGQSTCSTPHRRRQRDRARSSVRVGSAAGRRRLLGQFLHADTIAPANYCIACIAFAPSGSLEIESPPRGRTKGERHGDTQQLLLHQVRPRPVRGRRDQGHRQGVFDVRTRSSPPVLARLRAITDIYRGIQGLGNLLLLTAAVSSTLQQSTYGRGEDGRGEKALTERPNDNDRRRGPHL